MPDRIELNGDHVRLRSTVAEDGPSLVAIRATDAVRERWGGDDLAREFLEDMADDGVERLTIEVGAQIIGMVQFAEEDDEQYRHASIDIYIDPAFHRRGYARDAIRTLSNYLFDQRRHHRLTIDPAADNLAAIRCYSSVGFRPVGILRSYERRPDGTWGDGLFMECLASDDRPPDRSAGRRPEELELVLLRPDTRRDRDALERLIHDDFVEIGASGRRWSRDEMIAELVSDPDPGPIEVIDIETHVVRSDAALVTYRTRSADRTVLRTSLWLLAENGWRIRHHQGTIETT